MTIASAATNPAARSHGSHGATRARADANLAATALPGAGGVRMAAMRGAAALAPPRPQDRARIAQPVERVAALLALAGGPGVHHHGTLGDAVAVEDRPDEQLGALVLVLLLAHGHAQIGDHRAQAARRVGQRDA